MRKVIASMYVSLDGVMEDPSWSVPFWTEEIAKFKHDELFSSDTLLLGRKTYEGFATAWPTMTDEEGFADRMNTMSKYVVSTSLEKAEWNNSHVIKENIVDKITAIKQQPGKDILIFGSGDLIATLIQQSLIDEIRLMIHPIILGSGKRLFKDWSEKLNMKLIETKTFTTGVAILTYEPVR